MQISTWNRVRNKFRLGEMGGKHYIAIGDEGEVMIYGDGATSAAQLKSLKDFFGQIWDRLDVTLRETGDMNEENDKLAKALSQGAFEE